MKENKDPEWEVVDDLPSERRQREKRSAPVARRKTPFYKSTSLWVGISIGLLLTFAFPPFAIILRRLLSLWWLALLVAGYYSFKKYAKRR